MLKGKAQGMVGSLQDQDRGFYCTRLNYVSSQYARGKPTIALKPEDPPKIFEVVKTFSKMSPSRFWILSQYVNW